MNSIRTLVTAIALTSAATGGIAEAGKISDAAKSNLSITIGTSRICKASFETYGRPEDVKETLRSARKVAMRKWLGGVASKYGGQFADWSQAVERSERCGYDGDANICKLKAIPCAPTRPTKIKLQ